MNIIELIFSGEVIFALIFVLSLIIVVRAISLFFEESGNLRARLFQTDSELSRRRDELPEKKLRVEEIKAEVLNLKRDFYKVRTFYRKVSDIELEALRQEGGWKHARKMEPARARKIEPL
jgi:hypothetical protein